eukprot:gene29470-38574_t
MSADVLSVPSRNFYEWARNKLLLSLVAGAASMTLLGFCSLTAGESNAANEYKSKSNDDHMEKGYQSIAAGTGFASFLYFCSFVILCVAAIFISPLFCGSNNERKVIRSPQEIDTDYSSFSEPVGNPTH